jgi:hypothetical protein
MTVEQLNPPRSIAPFAAAAAASVEVSEEESSEGKLILLHDPARPEAWGGDLRCVTFATADLDRHMVYQEDRPETAWAWLSEALRQYEAQFDALSGTVTIVSNTSFSGSKLKPGQASIEIRASWTPVLEQAQDLARHLRAWQSLMMLSAGLPPLDLDYDPLSGPDAWLCSVV